MAARLLLVIMTVVVRHLGGFNYGLDSGEQKMASLVCLGAGI